MAMEQRVEEIENQLIALRRDLGSVVSQLNQEKKKFTDEVDQEFQKQKLVLGEVVESARREFAQLRAGMNELHGKTEATVTSMQQRIGKLEERASVGGSGGVKGYLPQKNMIPKTFTDKNEEWRSWHEEVADYMDTVTPGMKAVLEAVEHEESLVDEVWRETNKAMHSDGLMNECSNVWRLLKRITDGEAKKVVMSVKNEDGLRAWQKLKQRFEPGLAARQGIVMAEFSGMVARPAKNTSETVALITEMDRKMKLVEDISGEEVSDMHAKSVLVGILDPMTRQHTAMSHGKAFNELKKIVQEFANNSMSGQEAMQIGRVQDGSPGENLGPEAWEAPTSSAQNEEIWGQSEGLNAMGGQQCWNCKGFGHLSRDCPTAKGKGKGKDSKGFGKGKGFEWGKGYGYQPSLGAYKGYGKNQSDNTYNPNKGFGKGDGKAGGKGPRFGKCYFCGGDHFMRDCPKGGGKGGLRVLEEWGAWNEPPPTMEHTRVLSSLQEAVGQRTGSRQTSRHKPNFMKCHFNGCGCVEVKVETKNEAATKTVPPPPLPAPTTARTSSSDQYVGEWTVKTSRNRMRKDRRAARMNEQKGDRKEAAIGSGDLMHLTPMGDIRMFRTVEPDSVNAVGEDGGWEEIEFALDSGATETVLGENMLKSVETKEGVASRRGVEYEIATGELIPNLGEKRFQAVSEEGVTRNITAQVCDVNKALMSVKKVMRAGNRVVFDEDGTYVEDKTTGEKIWARDEGGMFMVRLWVNRKAGF